MLTKRSSITSNLIYRLSETLCAFNIRECRVRSIITREREGQGEEEREKETERLERD